MSELKKTGSLLSTPIGEVRRKKILLSPPFLIFAGFAAAVLLGTVLLMMPFATADGIPASLEDALFTAVSAVCVTGLVVRDTATYWSLFGQGTILVLIQIGGLGVVTTAAAFSMLAGRRLSIITRSAMQNAVSAPEMGGIVRLTRFILKGTFFVETAGALILMPGFVRSYGLEGIWKSVFHSISAFCNAGFDLMGNRTGQYSSLTRYSSDPMVTVPVMLLIIIGGIGFLTWTDITVHRLDFPRYSMQSKVILISTALLIIIPSVYFYFTDFVGMPARERVLCSLFQAVTPRTAGFNTADLTRMSGSSKTVMTGLMLIGGSPGSTAGGMKTTTFVLMMANVVATFRRKENISFFGRRVDDTVFKDAAAIFIMYIVLFLAGAAVINAAEGIPLSDCLFETASAVGTVGLTMGITPGLGSFSRGVLMALMFTGRVGGLTMVYAFLPSYGRVISKLPQENITVG